MRMPFRKICNVTHILLVMATENAMRLLFKIMCNVTYILLVRTRCDETAFQTHLHSNSHTIGHRTWRCNDTGFGIVCNVTHILLVIGQGMKRPTCGEIVQCHSPTVGHRKSKLCWAWLSGNCGMSHFLLLMWWAWLSKENVQCHSLPVSHRSSNEADLMNNVRFHSLPVCYVPRCGDCLRKMCNVTHHLLVIG